jgi:GTPase SAR1 family protein
MALFGAFSAGKSSFANALIGERVLPVSPNPTTAAINKIMPPQEGWPHGTAKVKMKKADAILQDVLYSLEILGVQASDFESSLRAGKPRNQEKILLYPNMKRLGESVK